MMLLFLYLVVFVPLAYRDGPNTRCHFWNVTEVVSIGLRIAHDSIDYSASQ